MSLDHSNYDASTDSQFKKMPVLIDFKDYEAIAALEYGSLDDDSFNKAMAFNIGFEDIYISMSESIAFEAICKMMQK